MMNTLRAFVFIVLAATIVTSCANETPEYVAQRITLRDLNTAAGYVWFPLEVAAYTPDPEMVNVIRQGFGSDRKIVLFVRPTCSCKGTQRLFPHVMKTFSEAGIDTSAVEVYSVRGTSDRHPYQDRIALSTLPAFFQIRNDVVTTFIDEANYNGMNADTLIANAIGR